MFSKKHFTFYSFWQFSIFFSFFLSQSQYQLIFLFPDHTEEVSKEIEDYFELNFKIIFKLD